MELNCGICFVILFVCKPAVSDRIERIESYKDSLLLLTTQDGSLENLRIKIELIELARNKRSTPVDLYGLLLLVPRGHYTIGFLRPDTWYGVVFQSEQRIDGVIHSNIEHRLARTANAAAAQSPPPFRIYDHREAVNGRSVENVYLTAKWVVSEETRGNFSELVVRSELQCENGTAKRKETILSEKEDEQTIEIPLDNLIEIANSKHGGSKQITAHIKPTNCHRLCWTSWLRANIDGNIFSKAYNTTCSPIREITAQSIVHGHGRHRVVGNALIIETDGDRLGQRSDADGGDSDHQHGHSSDIKITAIPLGHVKGEDNERLFAEHRVRSGISSNISLLNLHPNRWYAIMYDDVRKEPFHYIDRERFIVHTGTTRKNEENGEANDGGPVRLEFAPRLANASLRNDSHFNQHAMLDEVHGPPSITVIRENSYRDHGVLFHYNAPCDSTLESASQFWLRDSTNAREIRNLNFSEILCTHGIGFFCAYRSLIDDAKHVFRNDSASCSEKFCYHIDLLIEDELYESNKQFCVNITEKYVQFNEINGRMRKHFPCLFLFIFSIIVVENAS